MQMTMKKLTAGLLALTLLLALLAGCGSKNESGKPADKPETSDAAQSGETQNDAQNDAQNNTQNDAQQAQSEPEPEPDAVDPYAWMGLEDMPKCNYLDIMSTNNYVQVYDTYVLGIKAEVTDACKGLKTYQKNQSSLTYNLEGMIYSLNTDSKQYALVDMTESIEDIRKNMEKTMSEGINSSGRVFQGTGKSTVPQYDEKEGDSAEYDYYEYLIESAGSSVLERYFMRDGDVFAVYKKVKAGETEMETTNVIKSLSGDVPDDLFVMPDLSDYTRIN